MTEDVFEKRYTQRLAWYDNNKNIRTLSSFVLEIAHNILEEDADEINYVNKIQHDLFEKGIIPFMIKSVKDRIRVDEMPNNEIKDFLNYVLLAYEYKDDDWSQYCDDNCADIRNVMGKLLKRAMLVGSGRVERTE